MLVFKLESTKLEANKFIAFIRKTGEYDAFVGEFYPNDSREEPFSKASEGITWIQLEPKNKQNARS